MNNQNNKKILVTSTDLMMIQFLVPHVNNLRENGYDVEVACSEVGGRLNEVINAVGIEKTHRIRLARNPFNLRNIEGLKDLEKIINTNNYDIIWTNEPVMGIMTRLASKKVRNIGTKVIYMVHGFHFYLGAPKLNWILWYSIEKYMAKYCDLLVTVNKEDYETAKKMPYNNVEYIHGIGINNLRLSSDENCLNIRKELGLSEDSFLLIAIGELNSNKNQQVIIKALSETPNSHLLLCGRGKEMENLQSLSSKLKLTERVHFLGYRKDVVDICKQSDVFVMSSFREGLPVASLEAMYCGLPLITSCCRGLVDVMVGEETKFLCDPNKCKDYSDAINVLYNDSDLRLRMGNDNKQVVVPYLIENTKAEILKIINNI